MLVTGVTDPQAQAMKFAVTKGRDGVAQTILAAVTAIELEAGGAGWQVQFAADKQDIAGAEQYVEPLPPSDDILSSPNNQQDGGRANPREWARVAQDLCDAQAPATYGLSYEGPDLSPEYLLTYAVDLRKDAATRCFDGPAMGDLAFDAMLVELAPE